jgi:hypothetical protein
VSKTHEVRPTIPTGLFKGVNNLPCKDRRVLDVCEAAALIALSDQGESKIQSMSPFDGVFGISACIDYDFKRGRA